MIIPVELRENERLDDLQLDSLFILQNDNMYKFTCDAVELANFVSVAKNKIVADFCSGSGIISILVAHKKQPKKVIAFEINEQMAEMSVRSIKMNNMQDKIEVVCDDVNNAPNVLGLESVDVVISNPPYRKLNSGEKQKYTSIAIARHEILINHEQLISCASKVLKSKGSFYIVHQFERLAELLYTMKKYNLEPKELRFLGDKLNPSRIIIRAVKDGGVGLKLV